MQWKRLRRCWIKAHYEETAIAEWEFGIVQAADAVHYLGG